MKGRIPMFWSKCQQVYNEWLKQQPEPVPEQDQLNFNKHWIQDWKKEYNVSHRKPNKKYVIKKRRSNNSNQGLFKKDLDGKKGFYQQMRSWPTCYQLRPNAFALQRKRKSKSTFFKMRRGLCKRKLHVFKRINYLLRKALSWPENGTETRICVQRLRYTNTPHFSKRCTSSMGSKRILLNWADFRYDC